MVAEDPQIQSARGIPSFANELNKVIHKRNDDENRAGQENYDALVEEARSITMNLLNSQYLQKFSIDQYLVDVKRFQVLDEKFSQLDYRDSRRMTFQGIYETFRSPLKAESPQVVSQCQNSEIDVCKEVRVNLFKQELTAIKRELDVFAKQILPKYSELKHRLAEVRATFESNTRLYSETSSDLNEIKYKLSQIIAN